MQTIDLFVGVDPDLVALVADDPSAKIFAGTDALPIQLCLTKAQGHDPITLGVLLFAEDERSDGSPVDDEILRNLSASQFNEGGQQVGEIGEGIGFDTGGNGSRAVDDEGPANAGLGLLAFCPLDLFPIE